MLSIHSPFYREHCIQCRLPINACHCQELIQCPLPFQINICSHSNEWQRNDNTGQWALISSQQVKRYRWHRKAERIYPKLNTEALITEAKDKQAGHYLLFPAPESQTIADLSNQASSDQSNASPIKQLWVIDGTWQEAKKMYKQSPWLQSLHTVQIQNQTSQFKLRRNQQGLSTMEAIEWAVRDFDSQDNSAEGLKHNFSLLQQSLLKLQQ